MRTTNVGQARERASRRQQSDAVLRVINAIAGILYNETKVFCRKYDWPRGTVYSVLQGHTYCPIDLVRDVADFGPPNQVELLRLAASGLELSITPTPHVLLISLQHVVGATLSKNGLTVASDPLPYGRRAMDLALVARSTQ